MCDLTHAADIFESLVGSESILLEVEHYYYSKLIYKKKKKSHFSMIIVKLFNFLGFIKIITFNNIPIIMSAQNIFFK